MSGSLRGWGLAVLLCAALMVIFLPAGASAQSGDCNSACDQFLASEGLSGAVARNQCLENCQKLKDMGAEGISIKCSYELPKVCGYELAWDFIRYCLKPCLEFKKDSCEDCLVKHGFCGQASICREWVCKCFIKNQDSCSYYYHKACGK